MMPITRSLWVVAKYPLPGQTKTRLSPPLSLDAAATLYESFLRDTLDLMRQVDNVRRGIAFLPADAHSYFTTLAPNMALELQHGASLGERLDHVLTAALVDGDQQAVVMDSDSPTLPASYLSQAFAALAGAADVVLGPCDDGGYYLIGLKRPQPRLLREVPMSTPTVLQDTLALANALGLRVELLPTWYDVDTGTDLERLRAELALLPTACASHTRRALDCLPPHNQSDN